MCVGVACAWGLGDAPEGNSKSLTEVAPDGAKVKGSNTEPRLVMKVRVLWYAWKAAAIEMREEKEGSVTPMRVRGVLGRGEELAS